MNGTKLTAASDPQLPEAKAVFSQFKQQVAAEGLLHGETDAIGEDVTTGISDDGALGRFIRGHAYNIDSAFQQYKATRAWRDSNRLIELYDSIDVSDYEETRKMYTHWTGRRDRKGVPICWFEIAQLTPSVMEACKYHSRLNAIARLYKPRHKRSLILSDEPDDTSCAAAKERPWKTTESESMLRLFCTYENLIRFVLPLCSAVKSRPEPERPVTDTTCIVDIGGVGLMQFWRLKPHMSAASTLATANYPETLGKTFILGAPGFFPTLWGWISRWFNQNTISKICIVPSGQELAMLSETIDPASILKKYGGQMDYEFGMPPDLDPEIKEMVQWEEGVEKALPMGPMRWDHLENGKREAIAVGTTDGKERKQRIMTMS